MLLQLFKSYKESFSGLPRDAWLLSTVVFVNRSGSMVLFFLSLYLTQKMGFTISEAGEMVSLYGLGALVCCRRSRGFCLGKYFICYTKEETGRQKTKDKRQKTKDKRQKTKDKRQKY